MSNTAIVIIVRILNATRHPRHNEAAAIVMYLYLYSLAFMDHPCTLGAAACHHITKTCLFKYTEILPPKKKENENFQIKSSDIFHISPQNIDCGYSLVLTSTHNLCFEQKKRKIMYTPVDPSFTV